MKKRVLSILLCLCMVLMLCPVTAFADENYTVTQNFKYGTYSFAGDEPSPIVSSVYPHLGINLGHIENCAPYEFVGWKESVSGTIYKPDYAIESVLGDMTFDAVYQVQGGLAITVNGFQVGKTLADCTYSFESTIPGVTFSADDVQSVVWARSIFDGVSFAWEPIGNYEAFEAGVSYRIQMNLDNKGLNTAPAVTVNGKTPEYCTIATRDGVPIQLQIGCTLGTPALPPITIDGPDVVCAQQDYEFTVTPPAGVTLDKEFGYDTGMKGGGADLTVDADGVGHGTVLTEWYDLNTGSFTLNAHGTTADGTPVTGTKTVQVSPEHIFVDGVCGCGAVQQYTVTYDGGEDSDPVTDVKTHGKDLTLRGETFTMDGFVQTGWVDKEGAVYKLGATYTADQDVTLYPVFEKLITLTVPYTTTVELSDVGVPGEKTFTLALIGDSAPDLDKSDVSITGSVTTNGKGSYNGTLTFTGPERTLWHLLSEGAFVQQVDAGADGWTVDDTVWGVLMEEIPVAYAMGDDATASGYTVYVVPASIDGNGYYYIDWENLQTADMAFTNTYSAHVYELKHDATHHWDECACKDVQNKELHKYGDWKVTKEATKTAKGEKEHTCTVCGYTEKVEIPKLGTVNTGDNNSFALWAALFTLSAAAVTVMVSAGKKKKASR
ncbi:MAG: InlB B-repeat-containing protein [Clostridiales bacterium]|nr:InlB B-repeat-containing protein [Clostridiales bacterium]